MKLFEKIRRFIRGADRAVTNAICERLDNTAEKLENFARSLDPEAFQESKMRESWEGRPKTDPETAARLAQMSVTSLEDAIDQITEGMVKAGFRANEAADAIRSAISAGLKPKPLSHLTNNWRKMHGLPMHRKPAAFRRRRRHPADADEEKHPKRASGMEPGKMSDLRTGMLETNVKTGAPAEENASSLHRVRTQNRK